MSALTPEELSDLRDNCACGLCREFDNGWHGPLINAVERILADRLSTVEAERAADAEDRAGRLEIELMGETDRANRFEAALAEKVARVEALADEWWGRATEATSERLSWKRAARDLRAALRGR